jgi:hypothetical protein
MTYVDLNPIRAKMADTPETCDYTSIQEHITPTFNLAQAFRGQGFNRVKTIVVKPLLHFEGSIRAEVQKGIPFSLSEYLQLVDWTGRIIRRDKPGAIPAPSR